MAVTGITSGRAGNHCSRRDPDRYGFTGYTTVVSGPLNGLNGTYVISTTNSNILEAWRRRR